MYIKIKKIFVWGLCVWAALIIVAEIGFRVFYAEELMIKTNSVDIFQDDPILIYSYVPDTSFQVGSELIRINKQGFIGEDFGPKGDHYRIAFVGACNVAGSVHQPRYYSFCPILQEKFKTHGDKVEVLNCGIDGDERSLEQYLSVEYKVLAFDPDMVVMEYSLPLYSQDAIRESYRNYRIAYPRTDPEGQSRLHKMVDYLYDNEWWIKPACSSYIFRAACYYYKNRNLNTKRAYIELYQRKNLGWGAFCGKKITPEESVQMIRDLRERLQAKGVTLFLLSYSKDRNIYNFSKENGLPLIPLNIDFTEEDTFFKDGHWNELGCTKVADRLYQILAGHPLIPKSFLANTPKQEE